MSFRYIYALTDFLNNKVNEESLAYEISVSDITKALDYINVENGVECHIYFKAELSENEHLLLDTLVANHAGEAIGQIGQVDFNRMQLLNEDGSRVVNVDELGRFQVIASIVPKEHELSGDKHIGQLSNDQIPDYIARGSDLITLSGVLYQDVIDITSNYYDKVEMDGLLAEKAPLAHDHDLRYYKKIELDSMIITTHSGLAGLDSDDHLQYLTNERGDIRYYLKDQVDTISGTLRLDIDAKADINHEHDDRYYTEDELNQLLSQKANIVHNHGHSSLTGLMNDDHPQYLLVNGLRPIEGDLVVHGNLLVSGTQFISQTETVTINDNILILNNGEVNQGVTAGIAGIEIDRGTSDNYRFLFSEHAKTFVVGMSGSERPVAIRSIHDDVIADYVPYFRLNTFDGLAFYELTTSGSLNIKDVASTAYVDDISSTLQERIDNKTDFGHTHNESDIVDLVHDAIKIRGKLIQAPTEKDDGKRIVYRSDSDSFVLEHSGYGGGGTSFPFSYFYRINDLKTSKTTNYKAWSTKLILYVDVPSGKFRIGWSYQWALCHSSRWFESRIVVDGDEIIYKQTRPKHYNDLNLDSGFRYIELEEGTHTILLQYKPSYKTTASIWNCELEFWKIGE